MSDQRNMNLSEIKFESKNRVRQPNKEKEGFPVPTCELILFRTENVLMTGDSAITGPEDVFNRLSRNIKRRV